MGDLLRPIPDPLVDVTDDGRAWARSDPIAAYLQTQHGNVLQKARQVQDTNPAFYAEHFRPARYRTPFGRLELALWIDADALDGFRFRYRPQKVAQVLYVAALEATNPVHDLLQEILDRGGAIRFDGTRNRLHVPKAMYDEPDTLARMTRFKDALVARVQWRVPTVFPAPEPWPVWAVTEGHLMTDVWGEYGCRP
jgi:hypothetical protein